jgi:hypothetical protein
MNGHGTDSIADEREMAKSNSASLLSAGFASTS